MDGALSRREREVADLVAAGLTNREIAERLVIAERTAEGHVEQIRNKLGFRSRSQIAAWVVAQRQSAAAPAASSPGTAVFAVALELPRTQSVRLPRAPRLSGRVRAAGLAVLLVAVAATVVWPRTAPATLVLVAGVGTDGFSGDGGSALMAQFSELTSLAFDSDGRLLVADSVQPRSAGEDALTRIRRIDNSGIVRTIVGEGPVLRYPNVSDVATTMRLNREARIAVGPHGDLYISGGYTEKSGHWVGRIDTEGQFTQIAGGRNGVPAEPPLRTNLLYPRGMAIGSDDTLYLADSGNDRILAISREGDVVTIAGTGERGAGGDGGPARSAALYSPLAVALSPDGALYIADTNNNRVRRIDHGGTITTVAGDGTQGFGGDSGQAMRARLSLPGGIAFGRDGALYIADAGNGRVRAISRDGTITTVAGPEELVRPTAVAVDRDGVLFIADAGAHKIYRLRR